MEFPLIRQIDCDKVGIATSVAKAWDFDWQKTIEWARSAGLNHVQLFIDPSSLKSDLTTFLKNAMGLRPYFHLPPQAGEATVQYCLHTLHTFLKAGPIVVIQHQQWANTVQRFLPFYPDVLLAVENDRPGAEPMEFINFLKSFASGQSVWAVLDIPRFYHQAPQALAFSNITSQIDHILDFLKTHSWPFIIHAIDQTEEGGERRFWRPFLKGAIPWLHFIKKMEISSDLLKCFLFEYEDWTMAKEAIEQITKC